MSDAASPRYIPRSEEQRQILDEATEVQTSGLSRAVLLYGDGGTGKTRLLRELPKLVQDPTIICLDPIDVDDSQHWLLSNLEQYVADELDPDRQYFGPYFDYVSELPRHRLMPTSRETVLSHLNRIKEIFTQCYAAYIGGTGRSVVVAFDTVDAIRGIYLMRTLTRWMKALPRTLFILAGRPPSGIGDGPDPIRTALGSPPAAMVTTVIKLGRFDAADCRDYLAPIAEEADLSAEETEKLVHLTQGHPLWLALTVNYLAEMGMPAEMQAPLDKIWLDLPYHDAPTYAGRDRAESFKRHLVAPYQDGEFWHEAIRRLAVVRESVSQPVWQQLMADRPLPADVTDLDRAWEQLRAIEWIRPRANRRHVTLQDSVAEELALRVIELHDVDQRWRQDLWHRTASIYADEVNELERVLAETQPLVDSRLHAWSTANEPSSAARAVEDDATLIRDIAELDRSQQELNQLRAAQLFYQLLSDYKAGARQFVALLGQARRHHDVLFEDLLAFQMQRFLPGGADQEAMGDIVGAAIYNFREWLSGGGQDSYVDIGLVMAAYLIDREQPDAAVNVLDRLPVPSNHGRRYRLRNLQGNACMRIPGRVREAQARFQEALAMASKVQVPDQFRYIADAHKELGYYYRSIGHWKHADEAYERAREAIAQAPSQDSRANREEIASIHTNWAYLKGIGGRYDDGISLVESAITIRARVNIQVSLLRICSCA